MGNGTTCCRLFEPQAASFLVPAEMTYVKFARGKEEDDPDIDFRSTASSWEDSYEVESYTHNGTREQSGGEPKFEVILTSNGVNWASLIAAVALGIVAGACGVVLAQFLLQHRGHSSGAQASDNSMKR